MRKTTPQPAALPAIPQFSMVVPLRSQARLWHSLLHWAYFALLRAQRARFVRPLRIKGSLLVSGTIVRSCPAKSLLFPEGKRGARRPPPVAETGRSKPSETGNIASALCARSEATMLNCGTVARRSRDRGIDQRGARRPSMAGSFSLAQQHLAIRANRSPLPTGRLPGR